MLNLFISKLISTGNRQCCAHGLQNTRISCREVNVTSRTHPLNTGDPDMFGALFLSFVAVSMCFAIKACLGNIYVVDWS